MAESRLRSWETLFSHALQVIDCAAEVMRTENWSFGGGTVLMRRHRHRFSKDIDIFVPDPQYLGYLSPELNDEIAELTSKHVRQANFLKLYFPEGEVDFIVSASLTRNPTVVEQILERPVRVETSVEILGKKVHYRGAAFTARDIFDFALVVEAEPEAMGEIGPLLREKREAIAARVNSSDTILRKTFAQLDVIEYRRSYEECVDIMRQALDRA